MGYSWIKDSPKKRSSHLKCKKAKKIFTRPRIEKTFGLSKPLFNLTNVPGQFVAIPCCLLGLYEMFFTSILATFIAKSSNGKRTSDTSPSNCEGSKSRRLLKLVVAYMPMQEEGVQPICFGDNLPKNDEGSLVSACNSHPRGDPSTSRATLYNRHRMTCQRDVCNGSLCKDDVPSPPDRSIEVTQ